MKDYGTLSQAINKLKLEEGYEYDFNLLDEKIELKSEKEFFHHDEFEVDKVLRFEGMSNPDDNAILYAVTTNNGKKGVLVDGYGISSGQISKAMLDKLDLKEDRPISDR
ncbi:phosphoribosylpyrophosphate synthetase [Gillisia sp. M10.2A]|uniref:Phosphoribosylpyrophosphate synthetase n=1 Tax=Gillisia lutea TaxID=2909668 RepID=A0ABS9EIJ6_9FLAO|nr:phosphoribosylpyrophosphate synthetase [Gillisia lutea]MCF4102641.1 phosphoribosylpyrophosphate synthetase [Gillisia lutea]